MTLFKSQQNFQSPPKIKFPVHSHLKYMLQNVFKMTGVKTGKQHYKTFLDFTSLSNNTDVFRELLANNTTHFSRVYIKQAILTFSESYYQTILTYSEDILKSVYTFTELLPNNSKHFFESLNGHSNRQKILKQKIPK